MFASESGTDTATKLIERFFPAGESKGNLIVSRRSRNGIVRGKIPAEYAALFAKQSNCFCGLRVSTATFLGKDVILNIAGTRVVSFQVPFSRLVKSGSPIDFIEKVSWRLRAADLPQFSGVLTEQEAGTLFWILDEPLGPDDFYDGSVITQGVDRALGELATLGSMTRVSDVFRLPVGNSSGDAPSSLYSIGTIPTTPRKHLYQRALKRLTSLELDAIRRSGEIIKELRDLFFVRLMDGEESDTHWYWLSALSAVLAPFTDPDQHGHCLVAIAESLTGKAWSVVAPELVAGWNISYAAGIEIIREHSTNGLIRFPQGQYWINGQEWIAAAAAGLRVSQREVNELRLTYLVPKGMTKGTTLYLRTPLRRPVGLEDFVPAGRLLMRAA